MTAHITSDWEAKNNAAQAAASRQFAVQAMLDGIRSLGLVVRGLITRAHNRQQANQTHNEQVPIETRTRLSQVVLLLGLLMFLAAGVFVLDMTQWPNLLSTAMPFLDSGWKVWSACLIVEVTLLAALIGVKWGYDEQQRGEDLRRATSKAEHQRALRRFRSPSLARAAVVVVFACAAYTNTAIEMAKIAKVDGMVEFQKRAQQQHEAGSRDPDPELPRPAKLEWARLGFPTLIVTLHIALLILPLTFREVQHTLGGFLLARREMAAFARLDKEASRLSGTLNKLERTSPEDADHAWRQLPADVQNVVRQLRGPGLTQTEAANVGGGPVERQVEEQISQAPVEGAGEQLDGLV